MKSCKELDLALVGYEKAIFPAEIVPEMGRLGLLGTHLSGYGAGGHRRRRSARGRQRYCASTWRQSAQEVNRGSWAVRL